MQIGVLFFTDPIIINKLEKTLGPSNTFLYEKSKAPLYVPKNEVLLGLNIASKMNYFNPEGTKEYTDFDSVEKDWNEGILMTNELIKFNGIPTSYGRLKIEKIMGTSFDEILPGLEPEKQIIDKSTIAKFMMSLITNARRAEISRDLTVFGCEVISIEGIDLPFNDLYDLDDPELQKILNDKNSTDTDKLTDLQNYIRSSITKKMQDLADKGSNYGLAVSSGDFRIKTSQNIELFGPGTLKLDKYKIGSEGTGQLTIGSSTLLTGLSEEEFVEKGLINRAQQAAKRKLTPESGYMTRQLTFACSHTIYSDQKSDVTDKGLTLKAYEAIGRTTLDGSIVKTPSDRNVTVRSCIFSDEPIVYSDQISNMLRYENGADIGISMAMAITESKTQEVLGIKHGGITERLEKARLECIESGTICEINDRFVVVDTSGRKIEYPIFFKDEPGYVLSKNIVTGNQISKGDPIIISRRFIPLDFNIKLFQKLFEVKGTSGKYIIGQEKETDTIQVNANMCYSPCKGKIHYNKNSIVIGTQIMKLDKSAIYFYPEGYEVNTYDRICNGVADLSSYLEAGINIEIIFNIFRLQLLYADKVGELSKYKDNIDSIGKAYSTGKINIDMLEVVFKALKSNGNSISVSKKNRKGLSEFDAIYFGGVKQNYTDLYGKVFESTEPQYKGKITDSIVLPLILSRK